MTHKVELKNGGKIFLKSFQSSKIEEYIDWLKRHRLINEDDDTVIHATGGGAYKYADLFTKSFDGKVTLRKHDEM
jgi:pantothenate kinase